MFAVETTLNGKPVTLTGDEHPRPDTTTEALAKLKPVFRE